MLYVIDMWSQYSASIPPAARIMVDRGSEIIFNGVFDRRNSTRFEQISA